MNIKSLMTLFLVCAVFISEIALSNEGLKHKLFLLETSTSELKKDIESVLLENEFQISKKSEQIFEIYYDTSDLHYYDNGYVRYQGVQYFTKRKKKEKYHESMQHYLSSGINNSYSVKHYNNVKSFEGKHPLLGLVKRKERVGFIAEIKAGGIKHPMRLKPIFQVGKTIYNYALSYENKEFMNLEVQDIEVDNLDYGMNLSILKIKSDEVIISQFDKKGREQVDQFLQRLSEGYSANAEIENEYKTLVDYIKTNNKYFYFNFKYPVFLKILYSLVIVFIGFVILYPILQKRNRKLCS